MTRFVGLDSERMYPYDITEGYDYGVESDMYDDTEFDDALYHQMFDESGSPLTEFYSTEDYYNPYFAQGAYGDVDTFSDTTRGYLYEGLMSLAGRLSRAGYRVDDNNRI